MMTMMQAHTLIRNGDMPMEKMLETMRRFILHTLPSKCTVLSLSRKWLTTHTIPMNCDMTVAVAAPRIPHPNRKMKRGARMRLANTVTIDVSIAFFGYPVARITLFSPIMV